MNFLRKVRGLAGDDRGLSTVEYVVLLVLIVGMSVTVWNKFGGRVYKKLQGTSDRFDKKVSQSKP